MNLYQFFNKKDGFIKINSNQLNIISFLKAFNAIEMNGNNVIEIIIHPYNLKKLYDKAKQDVFENNNLYKKLLENNEFLGAKIILDYNIQPQIIQFNGNQRLPQKSVKLFINQD